MCLRLLSLKMPRRYLGGSTMQRQIKLGIVSQNEFSRINAVQFRIKRLSGALRQFELAACQIEPSHARALRFITFARHKHGGHAAIGF